MYLKHFQHVISIENTVEAATKLMEEAKEVNSRDQHAEWWDKKVELLWIINDALETGYWIGELYDKLWSAKHIIFQAEAMAGKYVR